MNNDNAQKPANAKAAADNKLAELGTRALLLLRDLEWLERDPARPKALFQKRAEYQEVSNEIAREIKTWKP